VLIAIGNRVEYWIPGLKRGPLGQALTHAPGNHISFLAVSPDGRGVYTADSETSTARGMLRLWAEDTGGLLHECAPRGNIPALTTLSPDGRTIVTTGANSQNALTRLYDADTLTPLGPPLAHRNSVVAFSPDGRSLVVGCEDGTARLHEVRAPTKSVHMAPKSARLVGFADEGKSAFVVQQSGVVQRMPEAGKKWLFDDYRGPGAPNLEGWQPLALSPTGRFLLHYWAGAKTYRVFDLKEQVNVGDIRGDIVHSVGSSRVAVSADGKTFFAVVPARGEHAVQRWDVKTGEPVGEPLAPGGSIARFTVVDGGKNLMMEVVTTGERRVERWDLTTGRRVGTPVASPVRGEFRDDCAIAPDGKSALVFNLYSGVRLWDLETGKPRGEPLMPAVGDRTLNVFYSPDGRTLAARDPAPPFEVRLWDAATLKPLGPVILTDQNEWVSGDRLFAFSPDGKRCTAIVNDKLAVFDVPQTLEGDAERIRLWVEVNTGKELDAGGAIVELRPEEWLKRWERLQKLGGLP
jgi:WD40 repeat protein